MILEELEKIKHETMKKIEDRHADMWKQLNAICNDSSKDEEDNISKTQKELSDELDALLHSFK